jgi:hypothetical protein
MPILDRALWVIMLLLWSLSITRADPLPTETEEERQLRQVIFSSGEFANGSMFIGSGFKRAFGKSIDEPGFVLMSLSGAGATPEIYNGPANTRIRVARMSNYASMMIGYQWFIKGGVFMVAAGPETSQRQEIDDLGRPRWLPRSSGLRTIAEVWHEPRPRMMAQATLIYSSAQASLWGRMAGGYALRDGLFFGPEATGYIENDYREARLGLHLTGIKIWRFEFRLSGGLSGNSNRESGYYVGISSHFKR